MVPVMAIPLDRMPLSNHAKIDRKALKALPLPKQRSTSAAQGETFQEEALSETMVLLKRLWQQVLKGQKLGGINISPPTSFFEIGGDCCL